MIGCLQTCVCKQPIIALYIEIETVLKFYNLEAWSPCDYIVDTAMFFLELRFFWDRLS